MAWLTNYGYRRKITIDHAKVDSTLTDFPMLVKLYYDSSKSAWSGSGSYSVGDIVKNDGSYYKCLTASTSKEPGTSTEWQDDWQYLGYEFDFSKVRSDGYDIRFTASDETTLRSYERAEFSKSSEPYSAMFFVLVPSVSSSAATELYLYYGYSSATDASAPSTVWADYELVSHMGSTLADATGNHTLTNYSSDVVDSLNGKGREFNGTSEYVDTNYYPESVTAFGYTTIMKANTDGAAGHAVSGCHDGNNHRMYNGTYYSSGHTNSLNMGDSYMSGNAVTYGTVAFHHAFGFESSNEANLLHDGAVGGTPDPYTFSGTSSLTFVIGGRNYSSFKYFDGIVDEVRIMLTSPTADWGEVEYADMVRHELHSIGTEEAASQTITGSALLTGTGSLSASGEVIKFGSASLSGNGNMTAVAVLIIAAAAQLTGTGVLQAIAFQEITAAAILDGSGNLAADGMVEVQGDVSLEGTGDLVADGNVEVLCAAVLTGTGSLTAAGIAQPSAPVLSGEYSGGCINLSW